MQKKLHHVSDPTELNLTGKRQIHKTAQKLKLSNPDIVYSSNEIRAIQSAQIISKVCIIKHEVLDGLQERNWGDLSGTPWQEIKVILDKLSLHERFLYIPPKGESWKEFDKRLREKFDYILEMNTGKTIVIVSHGGAIRALMPHLLNVPIEESFNYDPDNASITTFIYDGDTYTKLAINDTSHLWSNR